MWQQLKKTAQSKNLLAKLTALRGAMVMAAQEEYDYWEQDDEGLDETLGGGGICDSVSQAIAGVITQNIDDVEVADGGGEGDDHAWTIAYDDNEAYGVDIDHGLYESGGGYSWKKRPGVSFSVTDVQIFPVDIDREHIGDFY